MKKVRFIVLIMAAVLSQTLMGQVVFNQQEEYEKLYGTLQPYELGSDLVRSMVVINDQSADQFYCVWNDTDVPEIDQGIFKPDMRKVDLMWNILFGGIIRCNYFLENATATDDATQQQCAEARFLRAYFYSVALDLWGGVPINTSSDKWQTLPRSTSTEVFNFVVAELSECLMLLPDPAATTYGKASKGAARLLLARLYLNAQVYTGRARWDEAKSQAQALIDADWFSLCDDYACLFMGDNDTNGAERETVLPIVIDGINGANFYGTTYLIAATRDGSMPSNGMGQKWAGHVVRRSLLQKFFPYDDCPSATTEKIQATAQDDRCLFYGEGRPYGSAPFQSFNDGFSCVKFTNLCADDSVITGDTHADTDFPLLRFAEAYLILAEADARLNGGVCSNVAMEALNALRQRAHANRLGTASLDDIVDEWAREFYYEGRRRSDLVRFGLYSGNQYIWDGKGAKVRNLLPIPAAELARNPGYTQNPGYEDINKKPENLYMNRPVFGSTTVDLYKVKGLWFSWQRPTIFDVDEDVTYTLQLSASADFTASSVSVIVENTEELLYDAATLYSDMGRLGIADGDVAELFARVVCHDTASESVVFSVRRSNVTLPPHTWYILGGNIGNGGWDNRVFGLGTSSVPLGVVDDNTFRFSGHFGTGEFKMVRTLGSWYEQVGSYTGSVNDYVFNEASYNLQFEEPGNYAITLYYDSKYLSFERLEEGLPVYTSVSLIGGFTDWYRDIEMTRVDQVEHSWYTSLTFDNDTELKFRANGSWDVNWGADVFPYGQGVHDGMNIKVRAGTYTVFFNDITGDYLFLDATTGELPSANGIELVDGMYLNTAFATISVADTIAFYVGDTDASVQVFNPLSQQTEQLVLILGNQRLEVDAQGMVSKEQLSHAISQMTDCQVTIDAANHKRITTVQAIVRGYCDKDDVRVYTESVPFTIIMEEDFHLETADAYYYLGGLSNWDLENRSMPFAKDSEGVFRLNFTVPAGVDEWFKVCPSTTTDWNGDFVAPYDSGSGLGTGLFNAKDKQGFAWHIDACDTDKDYTLILDFVTTTYTLGEGRFTAIKGDVNGDAQVGIGDIVAITNVKAGIANNTSDKTRADVNGDGEVGIGDIVAITNIMAGGRE